jgi:RNA polymerase sigma-70 factor (ECF subfamily)
MLNVEGDDNSRHKSANKRLSRYMVSPRRSWLAETPGIAAVKLLQSSEERVVSRARRPAPSDAGVTRTREALLQACAKGDQTALHSLYTGTAPQLFGLALRILRRRELAEEVVQDSFLVVWRNAHTFDPNRGAAMAWLARIVRNRCIDVIRQRWREAPLDDASSIEDWEDPVSSPADLAELSHDARRLQECISELEEFPRKVLRMVYYKGMTYQEAAIRVGVPLGTAKSSVWRSLVRLRGCMER